MTNAHIEVEQRGPLSTDDYRRLDTFLKEHGTFKEHKNRIVVDYAESFTPESVSSRTKDIRLRVTNGVPEIIVKIGNWGGSEQRRELSALSPNTPFDVLVEIFAALGVTKGILYERKSTVYDYGDIEFALIEVPGHSYFFEAEMIAHSDADAKAAETKIHETCRELGITPFTRDEFFTYIDKLNQESNEEFDATTIPHDYFKKRFSL